MVFLLVGLGGAQPPVDWENPAVFNVNKEPPHATLIPYADVKTAVRGDRTASPNFQSLDGTWKFHWPANPGDRPADFYRGDFNTGDWTEIPVPSNWQLHGWGLPIYVNIRYPFSPAKPPKIPHDNNAVGSYRRTFTVPDAWDGRQVFLVFDGVEYWLNVNFRLAATTPWAQQEHLVAREQFKLPMGGPKPEYRLTEKSYGYQFRLRPFSTENGTPMELARKEVVDSE